MDPSDGSGPSGLVSDPGRSPCSEEGPAVM
jgi:hypothetical protein